MKIEQIELYHISMPLVSPFETSFGVETDRHGLIAVLRAGGLTGYGECVASREPGYSYETATTAWHILSDFIIPSVLGMEFASPADVIARFAPVRGHNMAKAALEMAVWDVLAQAQNVSLSRLLGGTRPAVSVGVSVGIHPTTQALLDRIERYLAEGYGRIKIKIKPGWDLEVVRQVRAHWPKVMLQVDANSAYTLADQALFEAMDEFKLLMIEQPLADDDIYEHSLLQPHLDTPICLDESIHSAAHARAALGLKACRVINIKVGRVGGLAEARRIHDLCYRQSTPVWCGGMLETGIGRAANVAIASLPGFTLPGDISASARYYAQDLVEPPFTLNSDSTISVPTGPGLGVQVVESRLRPVALRHGRFAR
jgi:O-succinylbenzoate synthase